MAKPPATLPACIRAGTGVGGGLYAAVAALRDTLRAVGLTATSRERVGRVTDGSTVTRASGQGVRTDVDQGSRDIVP